MLSCLRIFSMPIVLDLCKVENRILVAARPMRTLDRVAVERHNEVRSRRRHVLGNAIGEVGTIREEG